MLKLENFKNNEVAKALETLAVTFNYKATIVALPHELFHVVHGEQEFSIRGLENLIREIVVAPWDKSHASHDETAGRWERNDYGIEVWKSKIAILPVNVLYAVSSTILIRSVRQSMVTQSRTIKINGLSIVQNMR